MDFRDLIYPPGATQRDWLLDGALAATLMLMQVASAIILGPPYYPGTAWELLVCLGMLGALVFRRHSPLLTLGLVTIFGVANLSTIDRPTFSLIAVPIVSYAVARYVPGHVARSVLAIGAVASVLGPAHWFGSSGYLPQDDTGRDAMLLFTFACLCFGAVATPYIVGRRAADVADAREREQEAERERYARVAREREQQSRLAEASTRAQIARELHDVVAHSLSIMIVQAEGGRASARRNPEAANRALDTIAEVGRESLVEMRRIVGVLRGATEGAELMPSPTLDAIPELVHRSNPDAEFVITGTVPESVTPALELTVYRVVQEALTNVLKHAGPRARARVVIEYASNEVAVEVVDDGASAAGDTREPDAQPAPDSPPFAGTGGNGLRGMAERVASMGGRLRAGPRDDGPGFRVQVVLPIRLASADGSPRTDA